MFVQEENFSNLKKLRCVFMIYFISRKDELYKEAKMPGGQGLGCRGQDCGLLILDFGFVWDFVLGIYDFHPQTFIVYPASSLLAICLKMWMGSYRRVVTSFFKGKSWIAFFIIFADRKSVV